MDDLLKLNPQLSCRITEFDALVQRALNVRSAILQQLRLGQPVVIENEKALALLELD